MIGFVALIVTCTVVAVNANRVQVTLYYESLCPFSQSFFTDQLTPTWRDLKDYMNLELVPFGKSNSTDYNDTSEPSPLAEDVDFTCQHGPNECIGNKYQACVLNPEYQYKLEDQMNYIDCMMRDAKRAIPYAETVAGCVNSAGGISVQTVKSCTEGAKGNELLLQNERKTNSFQKPIVGVPTVVLDNSYSPKENDEASFRTVLCRHITDSPKPRACEDHNSTTTEASQTTAQSVNVV